MQVEIYNSFINLNFFLYSDGILQVLKFKFFQYE